VEYSRFLVTRIHQQLFHNDSHLRVIYVYFYSCNCMKCRYSVLVHFASPHIREPASPASPPPIPRLWTYYGNRAIQPHHECVPDSPPKNALQQRPQWLYPQYPVSSNTCIPSILFLPNGNHILTSVHVIRILCVVRANQNLYREVATRQALWNLTFCY
jgi:hypothetical protein